MNAIPGNTDRALPELSVVHWGQFSGTVPMLEPLLRAKTRASFHDLADLTRSVRLLPSRAAAHMATFRRAGPWYKTGIWSKAIQAETQRNGWVAPNRPTLFMQTLAAPVLSSEHRYAVYTDRVAREGANVPGEHHSTWGPGWADREEQFLRGASAVFVMGPSTADALVDMYHLDATKVHLVGAGPGSAIGEIGREARPPTKILFVGTNWNLKGGPDVVAAFAGIREEFGEVELILVGSDPGSETLPPGVRVLGRVPAEEMPRLFAEADMFVVPTYMEALGYSLLEALMHGLPAIGSTVGNQAWLIGEAGLTVEAGNHREIREAMVSMLRDHSEYKRRAVDRAEELRRTMTWSRVASSIVDLFVAPESR